MAATFEDFIQSPQFIFLVGDEEKPIVVHAAAIAATSPQLNALINNGMEESENRCARMEDIEVNDFIRFCKYAYRGDYSAPLCEDLPPESSSAFDADQHEVHEMQDDSWGFPSIQNAKTTEQGQETEVQESPEVFFSPERDYPETPRGSVARHMLRSLFNSREYSSTENPKAQIQQNFEANPNNTENQDFTPVFLAHARLYCFAHLHLIGPLKALTLKKLHKTLVSFELYPKRIGDIVELARYAYSNLHLPDRNNDGTINQLRALLVEYIVSEIDKIGRNDEFINYMEEGGEFVGDFWRIMRDHVG